MKLLLIEKNGALVQPISDARRITTPKDQRLVHGAKKAVGRYAKEGWTIALFLREFGEKPVKDVVSEMLFALSLTPEAVVGLASVDSQGERCLIVKPNGHYGFSYDFEGQYLLPETGIIKQALKLTWIPGHPAPKVVLVSEKWHSKRAAAAIRCYFTSGRVLRKQYEQLDAAIVPQLSEVAFSI